MTKQQLRYFLASFSLSILFYLGIMGIFIADINSRSRGFGDENALLLVQPVDESHTDITFLGKGYTLDTSVFTQITHTLAPLHTLVPVGFRVLPDLVGYAKEKGWTDFLSLS